MTDDPNNPTGSSGLIAIDKRGSFARFLHPTSFEELANVALPARPHEVAISPDHRTAYVSVYGSGVYGNNPDPDHRIVVIDLAARQVSATFDVSPHLGPHGLAVDREAHLYVSCDASGLVVVVEAATGKVDATIQTSPAAFLSFAGSRTTRQRVFLHGVGPSSHGVGSSRSGPRPRSGLLHGTGPLARSARRRGMVACLRKRAPLAREQLAQVHAGLEDVLPEVALLGQALGHVQEVEVARVGVLQLFPPQGCRHARPRNRAG